MSSFLFGAALKGLGDGASSFGKSMLDATAADQKRMEERALRRELEDQRQQDRLELLKARMEMGATAGVGGSRSRSGGAASSELGVLAGGSQLFAPGSDSEMMAALRTDQDAPQVQQYLKARGTGDWSGYETNQTVEGSGPRALEPDAEGSFDNALPTGKPLPGPGEPVQTRGLPPGFEAWRKKMSASLSSEAEVQVFGKDTKDIEEGRKTADIVRNANEYGNSGKPGALQAALLAQGKDPNETAAKADRAEADADLKDRTDPNRPRGNGGAGKAPNNSVQSKDVDEEGYVITIMRDGSAKRLMIDGKPVKRDNFEKRVDSMAKELAKSPDYFGKSPAEIREAARGALMSAPAPAPAPTAAPRIDALPAGAKQVGTSKGRPVYETPDGKRYIGN